LVISYVGRCLFADEIAAAAGDEVARHLATCEACRERITATTTAAAQGTPEPRDDVRTVNELPPKLAEPKRVDRKHASADSDSTAAYALATLRDEEVRSARLMIRVGRVIGIAALLPLPLLGGSQAMRIAFAVSVVFAITVGIVIERRIRVSARYTEAALVFLAVSVLPAGLVGMLYWGAFSGAQLFPVLALYFFSRRERFSSALAIYLATAFCQVVAATLVISELIDDPGIYEPRVSPGFLVIGHLLIQTGDFVAFLAGWHSHRATRAALENMQQAMVLAAKREALLQEARQELKLAMGVGGIGRYTDHSFGGYRLGKLVGRGGMGEVYEARHLETNDEAAVKLLPPSELANAAAVERFLREVGAVSQLHSPNVVRVLGSSAEHDPIPYLVMELLRGHDLSEMLRGERPPVEQIIEMFEQVGSAIEEAWKHGIVHRDLKPRNLFHAEHRGGAIWKVLDFGVASFGDRAGTLTHGNVVGTPTYMAPEQARGERVDHRADVYALAAVAYRWLTGRPVVAGRDLAATLYQVVHVVPMRPGAIVELHPDIDAVLAIGLAKDPADRWSSVVELRAALTAAFAGRLERSLRQRAMALVERFPWDSTQA